MYITIKVFTRLTLERIKWTSQIIWSLSLSQSTSSTQLHLSNFAFESIFIWINVVFFVCYDRCTVFKDISGNLAKMSDRFDDNTRTFDCDLRNRWLIKYSDAIEYFCLFALSVSILILYILTSRLSMLCICNLRCHYSTCCRCCFKCVKFYIFLTV